ncbi:MAG: hypothetical protein Q8Q36_00385 [bacterium]|nr:hypothetical protein [bacterium]
MGQKQFLQLGGSAFVLLGILGFVGVLGPTADQSLFGATWWFDDAENWAHLVLGIILLAASFAFPAGVQKPLVLLVGALAVFVGIWGFASPLLLGANLENPADNVLHLAIGAWALWAGMRKEQ